MFHQVWDYRVIIDLFLGGIGIGTFLFGSFLFFLGKGNYSRLVKISFTMSPILVLLGIVSLLTEMGQPIRAMFSAPFMFQATSVVSWGTILQGFFLIVTLYIAWLALKEKLNKTPRAILVIATVLAVIIGFYHGLLLTGTGRAGWEGIVPVIFFVSSLTSGTLTALAISYLFGSNEDNTDKHLNISFLLGSLIVFQFISTFLWKYALIVGNGEQQALHQYLCDNYQMIWVVGVNILGVFLPGIIILWNTFKGIKYPTKGVAIISFLTLTVGVFALKAMIIVIGQM